MDQTLNCFTVKVGVVMWVWSLHGGVYGPGTQLLHCKGEVGQPKILRETLLGSVVHDLLVLCIGWCINSLLP
jgi:hypothetical protein